MALPDRYPEDVKENPMSTNPFAPKAVTRSKSQAELFSALSKFQGEFSNPPKNKEVKGSYTFAYATFDALWEAARKGLAKNGLAVIQEVRASDDNVQITTTLGHSSGDWRESTITMPVVKPTAQAVGSAITYGRRYAFASILGICADDDDDGNQASGNQAKETGRFTKNGGGAQGQPVQKPVPAKPPQADEDHLADGSKIQTPSPDNPERGADWASDEMDEKWKDDQAYLDQAIPALQAWIKESFPDKKNLGAVTRRCTMLKINLRRREQDGDQPLTRYRFEELKQRLEAMKEKLGS